MKQNGWKSRLKDDPTEWLLEEENPSVRCLALVDLCGRPERGSEVSAAKRSIMAKGPVPRIMEKMEAGGHWENPERFYTAKYKGTSWQLLVLAALCADGQDERLQKARDFILDWSQDRESGGFAYHHSTRAGGGRHGMVIPCLTGNMVWALIRLGYADDTRVKSGIAWIAKYQRFDDAEGTPPKGWPYEPWEMCWGRHTCHLGAVKALKALAEIPEKKRSTEVKRTIADGVEYFLAHRIHKRSHDLSKVSRPGWLRFGFPLMYQADVLEILDILTRLGVRDERLQEAVDAVVKAQDERGRWTLAATMNGRFQVNIEAKGKPSKWITLHALRVLKRFYGTP